MPAVFLGGNSEQSIDSDSPTSYALTIPAGDRRLLLVAAQHVNGSAAVEEGALFNGVAMTLVRSAAGTPPGGAFRLWAIADPAVGAGTLQLPISIYGRAKVMWAVFGDCVASGSRYGTSFETTGNSNAPSTGTQTVASGAVLFAAFTHNYSTGAGSVSAGTAIANAYDGAAGRPFGAARRADSGAIAWTTSDGNPWAVLGVPVLGDAGGAVAPSITTQPVSVTVTVGQTATFSVAASGSGTLTYQWQRNGTNISGATSASYSLTNAQTLDSGAQFRCVVTGDTSPPATSSAATLTVTAATATQVIVSLTTDGTTPAANLSGLKWAYWDQITPDLMSTAPVARGSTGSTNPSGVFTASIVGTVRAVGQTGFLVVTNSDGTTTQGATLRAFASPVQVS